MTDADPKSGAERRCRRSDAEPDGRFRSRKSEVRVGRYSFFCTIVAVALSASCGIVGRGGGASADRSARALRAKRRSRVTRTAGRSPRRIDSSACRCPRARERPMCKRTRPTRWPHVLGDARRRCSSRAAVSSVTRSIARKGSPQMAALCRRLSCPCPRPSNES
jgi:hypothetical protein